MMQYPALTQFGQTNLAKLHLSPYYWPGGSMRYILRIHTNYDFIDLNSVSVIAVKCARSCCMGLRYNATLVMSFMNVMPVL